MKKLFLLFAFVLFICSFSACVSMRKDCQGVRHTRLKNGIYI